MSTGSDAAPRPGHSALIREWKAMAATAPQDGVKARVEGRSTTVMSDDLREQPVKLAGR